MRLAGKVAIITGAASGMGRATALLFAQEGARVVVVDWDAARGQETADIVTAKGGKAIFVQADVSKAADADRIVGTTLETFDKVDVLFNNAGVTWTTSVLDTTEDLWDREMGVNLKSVFLLSKRVLPEMIRNGGGVILSTSSNAGIVGRPGLQVYGAGKAGIVSMTKSMALAHARQNIRVNCICPGSFDTPMQAAFLAVAADPAAALAAQEQCIPMGRLGRPEEIAHAALFLASDEASYITGVALPVDGGRTAGIAEARFS